MKTVPKFMRLWLNKENSIEHPIEGDKKVVTHIFWFSIFFNILLFAVKMAQNPPAWYTNDDFRMMTIISGAYTGEPCADIVFMRYPIGLLLSGLYAITNHIPWYGIFTELCLFVPSCIFCFYIVKKAYLKKWTAFGVVLYILLFELFIQKYVCLPQFTLTSAFMGVCALVLLYEMPEEKNTANLIMAVFCSVLSFSVRTKSFYLLLPAILLVIFVKILKDGKSPQKYVSWALTTIILCVSVSVIDICAWSGEAYQEFKEFKEVRAEVYDYASVPGYYENMPFYKGNGIGEITYRAVSGRFLDIDETVNTENLTKIADYMDKIKTDANHVWVRVKTAFANGISRWYLSSDETVKYAAIFMTALLFICIIISLKKKKYDVIFPALVAGLLLEIVFLEFNGRIMARLVDLMLLTMLVVGILTLLELMDTRTFTLKEVFMLAKKDKATGVSGAIIFLAIGLYVVCGVMNMQNDLDNKSTSLRETTNTKLEALMNYTKQYPENFYFYDTYDFISCTSYVFETFSDIEILNNESTGSWNSHSPSYYKRNKKFGFDTAIDGLVSKKGNVYFISTSAPKMGISKTLKDLYNKKLVEVDKIQSAKDVLYVYMVTDDE